MGWAELALELAQVGAIVWVALTVRSNEERFQGRVSAEREAREKLIDRLTTKLHDHIKSPLHK